MGTRRGRTRWCLAVGIMALFLAGCVRPAKKVPFEQFLPEDTLAYLTFDDIPASKEATKGLPLSKIEEEPLTKKMQEEGWKKIEEVVAKSGIFKDANLTLKDLVDHFSQGQLSVAVISWDLKAFRKVVDGDSGPPMRISAGEEGEETTSPEPTPRESVNVAPGLPALVVLADVTGRREKIQAYIDAVTTAPSFAEGTAQRRYEYRGVTVNTVAPTKAPEGTKPDWRQVEVTYAFLTDDLFVAASDKRTMERVIAGHKDRPAANLARNPRFRHVADKIGKERIVTFYLDVDQLKTGLLRLAEGEEEAKAAETVKSVLADLALDALKAVGAGMRVHREGLLYSLVAQVAAMDKGVWKLSVPAEGPFVAPRHMPPDVLCFGACRVDWLATWRLALDTFAKHAPEQFNEFSTQKTAVEQMMQINFEQDLIGTLDHEVAVAIVEPPPLPPAPVLDPANPMPPEAMMARTAMGAVPDILVRVALRDAKRFEATLEKVFALAGQAAAGGGDVPGAPGGPGAAPALPFEVEEFRGLKLRVMRIPMMPEMKLIVCVTPDALLYAMGRGADSKLKAIIRNAGGAESLANNPAFAEPLGLLPQEGRVAVEYADLARLMHFFVQQVPLAVGGLKAQLGPPGTGAEGVQPDETEEQIKQYLELLKKYLHPLTGVWLKQADGVVAHVYIH